MKITKRTLTKWRKEALKVVKYKQRNVSINSPLNEIVKYDTSIVQADRILLMTQELLDQYLIKEK